MKAGPTIFAAGVRKIIERCAPGLRWAGREGQEQSPKSRQGGKAVSHFDDPAEGHQPLESARPRNPLALSSRALISASAMTPATASIASALDWSGRLGLSSAASEMSGVRPSCVREAQAAQARKNAVFHKQPQQDASLGALLISRRAAFNHRSAHLIA